MGRLLNPGLGELVDRLTILRLKLIHTGGSPTASVQHFLDEETQINMLLDRRGHPADNAHRLLAVKLQQVNAKLWEMEDKMAVFAQKETPWEGQSACVSCANTAISIWRANQDRNRIIREINVIAGSDAGPEKLP